MRKKNSVIFPAVLSAVILSGCGNTAETELPADELPSMTNVSSVTDKASETTALSSSETKAAAENTLTNSETVSSPAPSETISSRIAASSENDDTVTSPESSSVSSETPTFTTRYITTYAETSSVQTAPPAVTTAAPAVTSVYQTSAPQKQYDRNVTFADYFSDSLFIGDSICSGLKIYGGLLNVENCAARINVSTWGINKYTFQYKSNSTAELDALSIVKLYQPKKIYIWMGMNDLYVVSADKYASNLCDLAESYMEASPGCKVYAVSISPMSSSHNWNVELDGNNRVNEYNKAVKDKCSEVDCLEYINIHDCLTDSNGYLASENNGGDGIHLSSTAYSKVLTEIFNYMEDQKAAEAAAETSAVTTEETTTAPETSALTEPVSSETLIPPVTVTEEQTVTTVPPETSAAVSSSETKTSKTAPVSETTAT